MDKKVSLTIDFCNATLASYSLCYSYSISVGKLFGGQKRTQNGLEKQGQ